MPLSLIDISMVHSNASSFKLAVSTSLPDSGMVCILGKSGCGKSTLLHAIGLLQPINKGKIKLDNKEITNLKGSEKEDYLNRTISFVFQSYQLIEDQSVIFNVALPLMISGIAKHEAFKKAEELLENISFPKDKYKQIVNQCSGGEKQRVAVLRSMINSPSIVLADEPTGALDSKNSVAVMKLLKDYSSKALVIVVTHNEDLAKQYADRILRMQDGRIIEDTTKRNIESHVVKKELKKRKTSNSWINFFIETNFKKRFKRNLVSGFGVCFSLIFGFLLFGFSNGATKVIEQESLRQFDLGVSTISIQKVIEIEGSKLSLVQQSRLSSKQINNFVTEYQEFTYGLNYSNLVPNYPDVKYADKTLQEVTYNPIYSFKDESCPELLVTGKLPTDDLSKIVVNKKFEDYFKKTFNKSSLNEELEINFYKELTNYFDDEQNPYIVDYFSYEIKAKVIGIVDEVNFLNTPKIYYSYKALDKYLDSYVMNNLSSYLGETITYKDKVDQAAANEELSSYSFMLFFKDIKNYSILKSIENDEFEISNGASVIKEALDSFVSATTMGMEMFLVITSLGSVLILGITSFSYYSQDKHTNAILLSLGANKNSIFEIYLMENLMIGIISFLISLIGSILLTPLFNNLIFTLTSFREMIQIPLKSYMNFKFLLPILVFGVTVFTSILSPYLPISLSGKINISKELKEE